MVEKYPLGRNWSFSTIRDKNNQLSIRYAVHSAAPKGSIKKYLVFLNGRTEYIEKYSYLPKDFKLPKDFAFLTLDHRGQGASGGARGHIDSYESFIDDAKIVIDNVVKDTPYIMVCHSMGGLVGLLGHLNQTFSAKKLILSSPLLGLPDKPMPKPLF
ncbi:MAG: alpha/beta fold hydrolase [Bdellovibrionota bacterium]